MIYAEDIDGNSIHIDDAVKGNTYYFRYEDEEYEIIVAHGDKYRKHYKTKRGEDIDLNIIFHKDCQESFIGVDSNGDVYPCGRFCGSSGGTSRPLLGQMRWCLSCFVRWPLCCH